MKILLDECLPKKLIHELLEHQVITVPQRGWNGIKNGKLMRLAEAEFDVFITVDRNLSFQQNIPKFDIAVLVLASQSIRFEDLKPLIPQVKKQILDISPGETVLCKG